MTALEKAIRDLLTLDELYRSFDASASAESDRQKEAWKLLAESEQALVKQLDERFWEWRMMEVERMEE